MQGKDCYQDWQLKSTDEWLTKDAGTKILEEYRKI